MWLDRFMALVNPSHLDRNAALEGDLRRLAALATTERSRSHKP
jgi:hypothetical protein